MTRNNSVPLGPCGSMSKTSKGTVISSRVNHGIHPNGGKRKQCRFKSYCNFILYKRKISLQGALETILCFQYPSSKIPSYSIQYGGALHNEKWGCTYFSRKSIEVSTLRLNLGRSGRRMAAAWISLIPPDAWIWVQSSKSFDHTAGLVQ